MNDKNANTSGHIQDAHIFSCTSGQLPRHTLQATGWRWLLNFEVQQSSALWLLVWVVSMLCHVRLPISGGQQSELCGPVCNNKPAHNAMPTQFSPTIHFSKIKYIDNWHIGRPPVCIRGAGTGLTTAELKAAAVLPENVTMAIDFHCASQWWQSPLEDIGHTGR